MAGELFSQMREERQALFVKFFTKSPEHCFEGAIAVFKAW